MLCISFKKFGNIILRKYQKVRGSVVQFKNPWVSVRTKSKEETWETFKVVWFAGGNDQQ